MSSSSTHPAPSSSGNLSFASSSAADSHGSHIGPAGAGAGAGPAPAMTGASTPASVPVARIRRRNRMITSCLECRRRKLKCDKSHPCANCTKFSRDCVFLAPALDSASQLKLTEIKEKMGTLERVLEQDVARNGSWREARRSQKQQQQAEEELDYAALPEDERDLEPTPLAVGDAVYYKADDEAEDELADLGFAFGKLRLTDRIGGFLRPRMQDEMSVTLENLGDDEESRAPKSEMETSRPGDYLQPGPTYLPPASSFFFAANTKGYSLIDYLPSQHAADHLIRHYWHAVHPLCRIVHKPSFQRRYDTFWSELRQGIEPVGSLQAVVFSAMFSAVVSMPEEDLYRDFAVPKKDLLENFQQGAETALSRAQVLKTTKLETMQAFVMYLIPLCRDQISRAHSALVGTAIRLAECMGLHRDGIAYGMAPVELHVRRMVWYQLGLLDIRTCEAHGPRPGIREGDYDTRLPLNVNDEDLERDPPPMVDSKHWTEMTATLIRLECNEMHRVIWVDRPKLETKEISLTTVLGKIERFRKVMHEKYLPIMDDEIPLHRAARLIMTIMTTRMHIMVLHRYHNSVSTKIPDRLRQIIRTSGTECVEAAMTLETEPALRLYAWYGGALQQYHTAFLLMAEVYTFPSTPETERIWRVIDYVFEPPQHLTRKQKSRLIMSEMRDRMAVYNNARKIRAPLHLVKRLVAEDENGKSELMFVSPGGMSREPRKLRESQSPEAMSMNSSKSSPAAAAASAATPPNLSQQQMSLEAIMSAGEPSPPSQSSLATSAAAAASPLSYSSSAGGSLSGIMNGPSPPTHWPGVDTEMLGGVAGPAGYANVVTTSGATSYSAPTYAAPTTTMMPPPPPPPPQPSAAAAFMAPANLYGGSAAVASAVGVGLGRTATVGGPIAAPLSGLGAGAGAGAGAGLGGMNVDAAISSYQAARQAQALAHANPAAVQAHVHATMAAVGEDLMGDIDWAEWDKLFPGGELSMPTPTNPGMNNKYGASSSSHQQ